MKTFLLCVSTLLLITVLHGQSVEVGNIYPNEIGIQAFSLSSDSKVDLIGTGGVFRDNYRVLVYYGWVIDAKTRKVVWHAFDDLRGTDLEDPVGLYDFRDDITLPAGDYELYFTGGYNDRGWSNGWVNLSFDHFIDDLFDSRNHEKFRTSFRDEMFLKVSASSLVEISKEDVIKSRLSEAVVYFIMARDGEHFEQGFTLTDETDLKVYAIGEGNRDEMFDYTWIYDAATRERVFEMDYRNTSFAGGVKKNLMVDEEITLPAGSYVVNYRSDGSHSFEEWNSLPPDDPEFWGVAIFPANARAYKNVTKYNPPKMAEPIAEIVRVRNHETKSVGFELPESTRIKIQCIGERGYDDMADYGWVVDADTRKTVWKMKEYRSTHAGGASKNRMVEDDIELPAGKYVAYYRTDDSHAYNSWNSSAPYEAERWGLAIWATKESDVEQIKTFSESEYSSERVISEILRLGDHDYQKEYFTLDQDTRVTITAIGEGSDGYMNDYGWIKSMDTGRLVWEMEYGDTEHAGGARKNRKVVETITLSKGEYRLSYETDGSHSYRDWNAAAPDNPEGYGISVLIAE